MEGIADLYAAVKEASLQRIRPKMMTVCAILFGLLPIRQSPVSQADADVDETNCHANDRGVVTSVILELPIYPVI
jgi:copper/silver efflux system protein